MTRNVQMIWAPWEPHRWWLATEQVPPEPVEEPGDRSAWLRLAATESLDRWLQLALDQALVDAERAAAQVAVAESLPHDSVDREDVMLQALRRARLASSGVTRYLKHLTSAGRRPPAVLEDAVRRLVGCYEALAKEVRDAESGLGEFDSALSSVQRAWHRFTEWPWTEGEHRTRGPVPDEPLPSGETRSLIDPRQVPSRLLALGQEPGEAEIALQVVGTLPERLIRVRVRAFAPPGTRSPSDDMLGMRLIDVRDGEVVAHGMLTRDFLQGFESDGAGLFEGAMPLPDLNLEQVRVDVYAGVGLPPAPTAESLRATRRAVYFLSSWRKLVADLQIGQLRFSPADRLRGIIAALRGSDADAAMWQGGPSERHLLELADLGDEYLAALIDDSDLGEDLGVSDGAAVLLRSTSGPGALLVAELASAYSDASR